MCTVGLLEEDREKGAERILEEIMAERFPNVMKDIDINIQKSQPTPGKRNSRPTLRNND